MVLAPRPLAAQLCDRASQRRKRHKDQKGSKTAPGFRGQDCSHRKLGGMYQKETPKKANSRKLPRTCVALARLRDKRLTGKNVLYVYILRTNNDH